jgi:uncharacterized membrane protein
MSLVMKILFLVITMLLVMMMTLFLVNFKKTNAMIKGLIKQVRARDELLE